MELLPLCSRLLLLPLVSTTMPVTTFSTQSHGQGSGVWRVLTTTDVENVTGGQMSRATKCYPRGTTSNRFMILEMALGLLWPLVIPNKYIGRGALCERTNPNHNFAKWPHHARTLHHTLPIRRTTCVYIHMRRTNH